MGFLPMLAGCSLANMPVLNPVGDVGQAERDLLVLSTGIMAIIVIPTIAGLFWVVWRYRASAGAPDYDPTFAYSAIITKVTLYVPLLTIAVLGTLTWIYTHRLDPYLVRPGGTTHAPYEIQAVALDYKWLFIYPEAGVATVNELVAPTQRPVTIRITSDPMMTSLFIPGLVSQIYAMTGMETRANFMAPAPAVLDGANAMYSGPDFFKQRFKTRLVAQADFDAWLARVAAARSGAGGPDAEALLDFARYRKLAERTSGYPVTYFNAVAPNLFQDVARQFDPTFAVKPLPVGQPAGTGSAAHAASDTPSHQRH